MSATRPYILIVDDEPDMRWMMTMTLRHLDGYSIETAINGAEALTIIANSGVPAVVITDLRMPVMNGVQLVLALRADTRFQEVPIIVVSGEPKWPTEVIATATKLISKGSTQLLLEAVEDALNER